MRILLPVTLLCAASGDVATGTVKPSIRSEKKTEYPLYMIGSSNMYVHGVISADQYWTNVMFFFQMLTVPCRACAILQSQIVGTIL